MERVYDLLEQTEGERNQSQNPESSQSSTSSQSSGSSQGSVVKMEVDVGPPKLKKRRSLMSRMEGDVTDLTLPAENIRKEVSEYLGVVLKKDKTPVNPLAWWAVHEVVYPNIAQLAKNYLSIPPTEVLNIKF